MEQVGQLRKSEEQRTRFMYQAVVVVSGLTMLCVLTYGLVSALLGGLTVVGTSFVDVDVPFSVFAKPVTYLSISSLTFFYCGLKLMENKIARWSLFRLSSIQLISVVIAFVSFYEVLYNFMLWGAFLSVQLLAGVANPNLLVSPGPIPWNLVFATKVFLSIFSISGYTVYFLRRTNKLDGSIDGL